MTSSNKAKILITFAILAVLITAEAMHLRQERKDARRSYITKMSIYLTYTVVNDYKAKCGRLPTDEEGLSVVLHPPNNCLGNKPIMEYQLKDAWGHDLHYKLGGPREFQIISYGKDNLPGGTGQDADLSLDDLPSQ